MKQFKLQYIPFVEEIRGYVRGIARMDVKRGRYYIYIDSTLPQDQQKWTLKHELAHIYLGHLDNPERDVEEVEAEADAKADTMTDEELNELLKWAI